MRPSIAVVPADVIALQNEVPLATKPVKIRRQSLGVYISFLALIIIPFVALIAGIALLWGPGVQPIHLVLMIGGYMLSGWGVTVGYHRLFTHKSFKTNRFITGTLAILGSMAAEGPVVRWSGIHRMHHQFSDEDLDPHSPHAYGHDHGPEHVRNFKDVLHGFWHSHIGWVLLAEPDGYERYVPDLKADPMLRWIDKTFAYWMALGILLPGLIAWAVTGTVVGGLLGVLWGGLVRLLIVHHITWSINSACHLWGARDYNSHDESRNNVVFGILGLGEGWHNNHHAFPTSARHGLKWWQFDSSWLIIKGLSMVGLASDVKVPTADRLAAKARVG